MFLGIEGGATDVARVRRFTLECPCCATSYTLHGEGSTYCHSSVEKIQQLRSQGPEDLARSVCRHYGTRANMGRYPLFSRGSHTPFELSSGRLQWRGRVQALSVATFSCSSPLESPNSRSVPAFTSQLGGRRRSQTSFAASATTSKNWKASRHSFPGKRSSISLSYRTTLVSTRSKLDLRL